MPKLTPKAIYIELNYLNNSIVTFQQSYDIGGTAFSNPIYVNAFLVQSIADAESVIVINRILEEGDVMYFVVDDTFIGKRPV